MLPAKEEVPLPGLLRRDLSNHMAEAQVYSLYQSPHHKQVRTSVEYLPDNHRPCMSLRLRRP